MSDVINTALERVLGILDSGLGANIGDRSAGLPVLVSTPLEWAGSRRAAEAAQASVRFENWLGELLPEPGAAGQLSLAQLNAQHTACSDVAARAKAALEPNLSSIEVDNFSMEPQGFSPPVVISTFEWIGITYVQQQVMIEDFGWADGPVEDFLRVYESGHLPVGCRGRRGAYTLLIW